MSIDAENLAMQLLLMPGIGADHRVFGEQRKRFADAIVPSWPAIDDAASVAAFAGKCWESWSVGSDKIVDFNQPFVVAGTSFGSLVALELAWLASLRGCPPKAVLILGGCRSWNAVPSWYGRWCSWSEKLPRWIAIKMFVNRHISHPKRIERLSVDQAKLLDSMFRGTDWQLLRAFAAMMSTWRRDEVEISRAVFPIHQIHGRLDHVLTVPSAKNATLLLDAGHYLCISHERAINNWIAAIMSDLQLYGRPRR
jgi:pimeloyl-ACP methyl ester carboxylesterase